jgi:Holliday junction DNA helicase RuvB
VGLEAIAATLNEDAGTLEDVVEPYLLQIGFVARTRQGRRLTARAAEHMNLSIELTEAISVEQSLFETKDARSTVME